jgi:hypothetical protein
MFGSQVGPSDAELNLCKWPKLFLAGIPDHCLAGMSSETFYLVTATAFILTVIWGLWPFASSFVFQSLSASGGQAQKREPALPSAPTQSTKAPLTPECDVWLSEAIWRAYIGTWYVPPEGLGQNISESEKQRFAMLVIREFRQRAFDGSLPVWGWRGDTTIWAEAPRDFWTDNQIDYIQVAKPDHPDEIRARADNPLRQPNTSGDWHHFMTSKAVIERLYPRSQ